jgi:preprotein translocase subunit SecE
MMGPKSPGGTQLDLTRYVHFIFIGGGLIATYLAYKLVEGLWQRFEPYPSFVLTGAAGHLIGAGAAVYLWRHERTRQLATETVGELSRVTWPTRPELSAATVVVIVTSVIVAIILGLFDAFWSWLTGIVY